MKKPAALLTSVVLLSVFLGCELLQGPDEPVGQDGGNLSISFGVAESGGNQRSITSGKALPDAVLASLRYDISLTGPGGETLKQTVSNGERLKLTVALGEWRIRAEAYLGDALAGSGELTHPVVAGINAIQIPMNINQGYFDISIQTDDHGAITADITAAFPTAPVTLTVTPNAGYEIKSGSLVYNDEKEDHVIKANDDGTYTFTMPAADVTVSAEFEAILYTVAPATVSNGSVSADPVSATIGTTITVTATPDAGYVLKSGTLAYNDGNEDHLIEANDDDTYTFTMPAADVTVRAEFEALTYSITPATLSNGTVSANPVAATIGTTITLTATPDAGYALKSGSLQYSYGDVDYSIAGNTFVMPAANVTISAFFNKSIGFVIEGPQDKMVAVSVAPANAEISWSGDETATFTVAGYSVEDGNLKWIVNGTEALSATGSSLAISAQDYLPRTYYVTAMIKENNQWYSGEHSFTVVE